jgi:hypothetical protein
MVTRDVMIGGRKLPLLHSCGFILQSTVQMERNFHDIPVPERTGFVSLREKAKYFLSLKNAANSA